MIEIKHAVSWADRRKFYNFSHQLYRENPLWEEPPAWRGRRVLSPAHNELMHLPHILLMAVDGKDIFARMLVGHAAEKGFFSLFESRMHEEGVRLMLEEACAWLRIRSIHSLIGPVSPVPADLGGGILTEGFSEKAAFSDAFNAPYYAGLLEMCGMHRETEWVSYRVDLNRFDLIRYGAAADYTKKRFNLTVRTDCARHPRMLSSIMSRMLEVFDTERVNRLIERLLPDLVRDMCPVVMAGETPVGWLLTLGKKRRIPRIATLWVDEAWRRKGITAILFHAAYEAAARQGISFIDASAVRSDNLASAFGVERAGGSVLHRHAQYSKQI